MMYKNAIVTVCYNHLDVTKKFLDSLVQEFDNTYDDKLSNYDLYILDNGSTDGTYEYLKEFQEYKHKFKVHVYKSDTNLGFGGGNNLLLKEVLKANTYNTVILLNNDTLINKNALDLLVEAGAKDPLVASTGPMSNYIWGRQQVNINGLTLQNYTQYANQLAGADNIHAEEVAFLAGFCLCIKTSILEKIGLFDEQFAIGNYEDNDYCLRIRNAGYKLVMVKEALIYHFGSQTIRDFNPAQLLNKNRALFIHKHRGVKEDDNVMISQLVISPRHKPNYFFQDIPNFRTFFFYHSLGSLNCCSMTIEFQFCIYERLKQFQSHLLWQTALLQFQFRTNRNNRTTGIVNTFTKQVLTETTLFTFNNIR